MSCILTEAELLQYKSDGFVVKNILTSEEVHQYLNAIQSARTLRSHDTRKMGNVQFLQPNTAIKGIQSIITNPVLMSICGEILGGGEIVLDGASLFCAERGVDYRQGWHRDVMQIPDDDIQDSWFSPDHFHNNVQINIPLRADSCLWLVKGSHARALTTEENAVFHGSRKMAPVDDRQAPLGTQFLLLPGQAVFYNNLAIHRGYGGVLADERMTIQLGFHSSRAAPTCHFGVLNYKEYTDEYLKGLDESVCRVLRQHVSRRQTWTDSNRYYQLHRKFVDSSFQSN
jgi:hypothetical protein